MKPSPSFDITPNIDDIVDDTDDCIVCGKLLLKHSETDASQCYRNIISLRKGGRVNSDHD